MNPDPNPEFSAEFRAKTVRLILEGRAEEAVTMLSKHYGVSEPAIRVGTVKRHRKVLACYVEKEKRIYFSNSSFLANPFVLLHEFYHHLRASGVEKSRQAEKRADLFAVAFIRDFSSWNAATEARK
jgi:Zn-dependent peptidase ImmA (M78 family)